LFQSPLSDLAGQAGFTGPAFPTEQQYCCFLDLPEFPW